MTPPAVSGEDAFGFRQESDALHDLGVGDGVDDAVALLGQFEGVEPVGRVADGERLGDGLRRADGAIGHAVAREGLGNRSAAVALGAVDARVLLVQEPTSTSSCSPLPILV